jgi:hypothetical protein
MKRSLSILTAAIFASAIAVPAFAQSGASSPEASPAAEASPAMSEKPSHKHHHHHKKGGESTESGSGGMAPSGTPSDSAAH